MSMILVLNDVYSLTAYCDCTLSLLQFVFTLNSTAKFSLRDYSW